MSLFLLLGIHLTAAAGGDPGDTLLLEIGDDVLLETGDFFLLE